MVAVMTRLEEEVETTWYADEILLELQARLLAARERHGPYASTHEAAAVIRMEQEELWQAIAQRDHAATITEAFDLLQAVWALIEEGSTIA